MSTITLPQTMYRLAVTFHLDREGEGDTKRERAIVAYAREAYYRYHSYISLQKACLDYEWKLDTVPKEVMKEYAKAHEKAQLTIHSFAPGMAPEKSVDDWTFQSKGLIQHLGSDGRMEDIFNLPIYEYLAKIEKFAVAESEEMKLVQAEGQETEADKEVQKVAMTFGWLNNLLCNKCTKTNKCSPAEMAYVILKVCVKAEDNYKGLVERRADATGLVLATLSRQDDVESHQWAGQYLQVFKEDFIEELVAYAKDMGGKAVKVIKQRTPEGNQKELVYSRVWHLWDEASETLLIFKAIDHAMKTLANQHPPTVSSANDLAQAHEYQQLGRLMGRRMLQIYRFSE